MSLHRGDHISLGGTKHVQRESQSAEREAVRDFVPHVPLLHLSWLCNGIAGGSSLPAAGSPAASDSARRCRRTHPSPACCRTLAVEKRRRVWWLWWAAPNGRSGRPHRAASRAQDWLVGSLPARRLCVLSRCLCGPRCLWCHIVFPHWTSDILQSRIQQPFKGAVPNIWLIHALMLLIILPSHDSKQCSRSTPSAECRDGRSPPRALTGCVLRATSVQDHGRVREQQLFAFQTLHVVCW